MINARLIKKNVAMNVATNVAMNAADMTRVNILALECT